MQVNGPEWKLARKKSLAVSVLCDMGTNWGHNLRASAWSTIRMLTAPLTQGSRICELTEPLDVVVCRQLITY